MDWYESAKIGLGREFSAELESAIGKISGNSSTGSFLLKRLGIRRVLLRRFPYKVIYHVVENTVVVICIFGERQDPGIWRQRLGGQNE